MYNSPKGPLLQIFNSEPVRSARTLAKPGLLPEFLPVPHSGSRVEDAVAHLVRQHQNLSAMVRLVREHVSKHGATSRPGLRPTAAREFRHAAIRRRRQS